MKEQWKPVKGFEGAYEVSSLGRVRRIKAYYSTVVGKVLKPFANTNSHGGDGYLYVTLRSGEHRKTKALHRLVAETFIPNPLRLPEVNHLGSKIDCRASQLEWRSLAGNMLYRQQQSPRVRFVKRLNKWVTEYNPVPYKNVWVGSFNTRKEAIAAHKTAVATIPYVL